MIYLDEPFITIGWDEELQCVYSVWKDYAYGEQFRYALNKGLELLKEKKASKVLVDSRDQKVMDQADQQWMIQDWVPRTIAAGQKYTAFVMPKSAIALSSINRIVNKVEPNALGQAFFADPQEAKAWLRSLN